MTEPYPLLSAPPLSYLGFPITRLLVLVNPLFFLFFFCSARIAHYLPACLARLRAPGTSLSVVTTSAVLVVAGYVVLIGVLGITEVYPLSRFTIFSHPFPTLSNLVLPHQ